MIPKAWSTSLIFYATLFSNNLEHVYAGRARLRKFQAKNNVPKGIAGFTALMLVAEMLAQLHHILHDSSLERP